MSDHLSVSEALALLDSLQQAVKEAAAKGTELEKQLGAQTHRERQSSEREAGKLEAQLSADVAQADALAQAEKDQTEARGAGRRARIDLATKSSLRRRLQDIESQEGRRKFEIQRDLLQTGRTRDADQAHAEQVFEQFKQALAETHDSYLALHEKVQASLRGYPKLLRLPSDLPPTFETKRSQDENELLQELRELIARTSQELHQFRRFLLPLFFRLLTPPWLIVLIIIGHVAFGLAGPRLGIGPVSHRDLAGSALGWLVVMAVLYLIGRRRAGPAAAAIALALEKARRLHDACLEKAGLRYQADLADAERHCVNRTTELNQQWNEVVESAAQAREQAQRLIGERSARTCQKHEQLQRNHLELVERKRMATHARLQADYQERLTQLTDAYGTRKSQLDAEHVSRWRALIADLKSKTGPLYKSILAAQATSAALFPDWQPGFAEHWQAPLEFAHAASFARLEVDVEKLAGVNLAEPHLELPGPARFTLPLLLAFARQGSILIETAKLGREEAMGVLNNIILRLLATAPTTRLSFTLIDPVGLGQNFAGITHLADYGENLLQGRIWTQTGQIEKRLADLNDHMEKVIQVYLRNEYETITDYNAKAGSIAEKYHFLVVADFPVNFSELAARRLLSIAASGARCGVFTLIHWDRRQSPPQDVVAEDLRKSSVCLSCPGRDLLLAERLVEGARLVLEAPPAPADVTAFIQKVGEDSVRSNRVEVPFSQVVPEEADLWAQDTTEELRVPIGRTGATKYQYLALGQGTRQHALIAGKTGSGKSTLFHVIITNLALWCSPEQVEFYLVDFKKGVEFKCYAAKRLPHARVVAIESDREFGLSVLQRVDEELRHRGELFRRLGAQDLAGYKKAGGTEPVPRSLLIIDEFQEFFVEDDRIAQSAAVLLDRLVRQGRAFGIHVLLGSQTLGGAYTLARTTLGQMVIRIALQCNEADAFLIMDDSNPAPRLLSRPGEAIYNDRGGGLEGNSPFQTVWLPEDVREAYLDKVGELASRKGPAPRRPIVFEGNSPADVRENEVLRQVLEAGPTEAVAAGRIWLGAPNSIKGPTEAVFKRQSGGHLLIVGQRDEAALAILSVSLIALAAQYPLGRARFIVLDSNPPGAPEKEFFARVTGAVPHEAIVAKGIDIDEALNRLTQDMKARAESGDAANAAETFLFIHGLQRLKRLRYEEDFGFSSNDAGATASPGRQLNDVICEGPALGFHVIAMCDTYNNVNRFLSRKALSEFEMRVLFQMSANDSASLIDSPKASDLGLHRALFYNDQEGYLETFRPYALPEQEWIGEAARLLSRSHS